MTSADAEAVLRLYGEGIETGDATFQTEVPAWETWDASHLAAPRLVARDDAGQVLGWCALPPVSSRAVYAGFAEESVYVATDTRSRDAGRVLLETMVRESEAAGIWTLQTGIFPENASSLALHEACGFRVRDRGNSYWTSSHEVGDGNRSTVNERSLQSGDLADAGA